MPSGEGNGNPLPRLQSTGLLRVGHDWATSLSLFTFTFHFHTLEKEMATHSSVHAWIIPGTGEPGGLPSMGSHRVGHDWSDLAAAAAVTSVWDECNCTVVWAFFGIAFLWDWNENCPSPVLWPLLSFPNLLSAALSQHHLLGFEIVLLEFHHLH